MNQTQKQFRILAVSLSSRGFGYAAMEGNEALILYGKKVFYDDKNARSLAQIGKLINQNQPDVLVLRDVNAKGTHRASRIKALQRKVIALAKKRKLDAVNISGKELRMVLLDNEAGTKQEMAGVVAKEFPDELASRLPPKRKAWKSEDSRMDIFDAVALALVYRMNHKERTS